MTHSYRVFKNPLRRNSQPYELPKQHMRNFVSSADEQQQLSPRRGIEMGERLASPTSSSAERAAAADTGAAEARLPPGWTVHYTDVKGTQTPYYYHRGSGKTTYEKQVCTLTLRA